MSIITVAVDIMIDRPAAEVFAYLSDFGKNSIWQRGMRECRFTSDPPLRIGSTYDQVAEFLGPASNRTSRCSSTMPVGW